MPCCRCSRGFCDACKCALSSQPCTDCSTSNCTNVNTAQQAVPVKRIKVQTTKHAAPVRRIVQTSQKTTAVKQREVHTRQKSALVPLLQAANTSGPASTSSSDKTSSDLEDATKAESATAVKSTAVQSTPDTEVFTPPTWEYYRGSVQSCILRMYESPLPHIAPSSNHRALNLVRSFMLRTWRLFRGRVDVISVRQVENPLLYRRYIARRQEIALSAQGCKKPIVEVKNMPNQPDFSTNVHGLNAVDESLHTELNECFLLHGTAGHSVDAIAKVGFDLRLSRDSRLYGRGIYLAETFDKAFMYTDFVQKKSLLDKQFVFVVRTTLGQIYQSQKLYQFSRPPCAMPSCRNMDQCTQHGQFYDSVVSANCFGPAPREFVVFDAAQCYPEFLVTFQVLPHCWADIHT